MDLGGVNEGRKDNAFGLGTILYGGEQLSWRPGGKNEIEEDVEVDSTGEKKNKWFEVSSDPGWGSYTRR